MQSRQALVKRALRKLKVLAAGQTPSAEDAKLVDDEIEDDAFVHLAEILANSVAGDFVRDSDENVRLMAEARLRELYAETLSGQTLKVEYY
jgi:hypothetical protein